MTRLARSRRPPYKEPVTGGASAGDKVLHPFPLVADDRLRRIAIWLYLVKEELTPARTSGKEHEKTLVLVLSPVRKARLYDVQLFRVGRENRLRLRRIKADPDLLFAVLLADGVHVAAEHTRIRGIRKHGGLLVEKHRVALTERTEGVCRLVRPVEVDAVLPAFLVQRMRHRNETRIHHSSLLLFGQRHFP